MDTQKKKNLADVLNKINKKFGPNTVSFGSNVAEDLKIKFIKTPSYEFNLMLGGGLPKGKIIEFFGENSSGKTSMALEIIALNQKINPSFVAGWFETEGSFDPDYAQEVFGVDMDRLVYWDQTDTGAEQGLDILRGLVSSGEFDLIVVNSVAGLTPKVEIETDMEKQNVGTQARMMSKLMRVITGAASKTSTTLLFINQLRTNIGVMFGNPDTTTGGRALQFYATQRIGMRKVKLQSSDPLGEDDGVKVQCKVAKNRVAKGNPYKQCSYYAVYGVGIDNIIEMPDILERENVVKKSGSWYYWEEEPGKVKEIDGQPAKWRSKAAFVEFLRNNDNARKHFEDIIDNLIANGRIKGMSLTNEEIQELEELNNEIENEFADEQAV